MNLRNYGFLKITWPDGTSSIVDLRPGSNRIGSAKGNEVQLWPDESVLEQHAVISCVETGSYLARRSTASHGDVLLNGASIRLQASKLLRDGDHIKIGIFPIQYFLVGQVARRLSPHPLPASSPPPRTALPDRVVLENPGRKLYPDLEKLTYEPSSYLHYLPSCFHQDDLINNLLLGFEDVLGPIEQQVDQLAWYFDPWLTTAPLLNWLAGWLGLAPDAAVSIARRRALVANAVELHRWRGTAQGLTRAIKLITGLDAQIVDGNDDPRPPAGTFWVELPNAAGEPERVVDGNNDPHPPADTFWVKLPNAPGEHEQMLRRLIEHEKPAHTSYTLRYPKAADSTTEATR